MQQFAKRGLKGSRPALLRKLWPIPVHILQAIDNGDRLAVAAAADSLADHGIESAWTTIANRKFWPDQAIFAPTKTRWRRRGISLESGWQQGKTLCDGMFESVAAYARQGQVVDSNWKREWGGFLDVVDIAGPPSVALALLAAVQEGKQYDKGTVRLFRGMLKTSIR